MTAALISSAPPLLPATFTIAGANSKRIGGFDIECAHESFIKDQVSKPVGCTRGEINCRFLSDVLTEPSP